IPIYASVKVVIKELFDWYKKVSGLYDEEVLVIEEVKDHVK
ncbi:TPA: AI-2E family transporter, partial [Streptococcus pyogenes]